MSYHDHHFHPLGYVGMVTGLDLSDAKDFAEVGARLADHAGSTRGAVIGQRLNDENLAEGDMPDRLVLDGSVPERPALVYRYCGHVGSANTRALEIAGVDVSTPDPEGGSFDREADGTPTGVVRETALQIVSDALTPLTTPPSRDQMVAALGRLPEIGLESITGMVSAGEPIWCGVPKELETLADLADDLPIDIRVMVITDSALALTGAAERLSRSGSRLTFAGWKTFADGSLGGHTAAMYRPYADRPDQLGVLRLDPDHTAEMARLSLDLGGAVAIHAIGDRANHAVGRFYRGLVDEGADPSRLRVEHASVVTDETLELFAALGVVASVQPAFIASETDWLEKRLGNDRMGLVYRFRSMAELGIPLVGGSDCPVEPPDPAIGIEAAVDRYGVNPAEALTRSQAEALFAPPI